MNVSEEPDRPVSVVLAAAFFIGQTAVLLAMGALSPASGGIGLLAVPWCLVLVYSVVRLWLGGRWGRITLTVLTVVTLVPGYAAVSALVDGHALPTIGVLDLMVSVLSLVGLVLAYLPASNTYIHLRSS
ncbi:hypothetical protein AB0383_38070 [Amycolatopsis sp. NPDC051373]|uniref:hypothetical protein n=1 Tax=Amycolatopsis sp. NPDC051373 TaxID=3155801 RepID=UPI00344C866E